MFRSVQSMLTPKLAQIRATLRQTTGCVYLGLFSVSIIVFVFCTGSSSNSPGSLTEAADRVLVYIWVHTIIHFVVDCAHLYGLGYIHELPASISLFHSSLCMAALSFLAWKLSSGLPRCDNVVKQAAMASGTSLFTLATKAPKELDIVERALQDKPSMLDVGAASAQSMFTGYLRIIFVDQTPEQRAMGLREVCRGEPPQHCGKLESFPSSSHGEGSSLHVLLLLVPMAGHVPSGRVTASSIHDHFPGCPQLQVHPELYIEPVSRDRAGVSRRQYGKHTMYSLPFGQDGPRVFFAMEWATAVSTLADMDMTPEDLAMQMKAFLCRLRKLVKEHLEKSVMVVPIKANELAGAVVRQRVEEQLRARVDNT